MGTRSLRCLTPRGVPRVYLARSVGDSPLLKLVRGHRGRNRQHVYREHHLNILK